MATKYFGSTPRENALAQTRQQLALAQARIVRLRRLAQRVIEGMKPQAISGGYWTRDAGAVLALKNEIEHERKS